MGSSPELRLHDELGADTIVYSYGSPEVVISMAHPPRLIIERTTCEVPSPPESKDPSEDDGI